MSFKLESLSAKCGPCAEPLVFLSRSGADDLICCPRCGGAVSVEALYEKPSGLIRSSLGGDELSKIRVEAGVQAMSTNKLDGPGR